MTYLPTNCFALIKSFVGFDPTYRHKKIAGMINDLKNNHSSCGLHGMEWLTLPCSLKFAILTEKEARLKKVYQNTIAEADLCPEYNQMQTLYYQGRLAEIGLIPLDYAKWKQNNDWCKKIDRAAKHLRYTRDAWNDARRSTLCLLATDTRSPLIRLLTPTRPGFQVRRSEAVTLKQLKQYCRENNMRGFSKHKKQALQTFILKYEF